MKIFTSILFLFLGYQIIAQESIKNVDLTKYVNKKVEYCDYVKGSFIAEGKEKILLLNMGKEYPDQILTLAIFEKDWGNFEYKPDEFLMDKKICVNGKLILYRDKPEIIVKEPKQIKITE